MNPETTRVVLYVIEISTNSKFCSRLAVEICCQGMCERLGFHDLYPYLSCGSGYPEIQNLSSLLFAKIKRTTYEFPVL